MKEIHYPLKSDKSLKRDNKYTLVLNNMLTCFQTLTFLCEKYLFINENYCFDYGYRFDHGVGSNAEGICILFSSFLFHVATRMQNSFWSFVSIIF